jgi:cell division transport system permease protein
MRTFFRIFVEIGRAVRYEILSTLGTLLTVFLAMTLPGALWIISDNLSQAERELKGGLTMDVFLVSDIAPEDITALRDNLVGLDGVDEVRYVSSQDALYRMREMFGLEMIRELDENPLPATFVLAVDESLYDPQAARAIMKKISEMPGVEDVVFASEMLKRMKEILRSIRILGLATALLVAFSSIFIVANTVRVAITDRRLAVEIMQLVGATRSYILSPFVLLGGILGLFGASLATLFLRLSAGFISRYLLDVSFLNPFDVIAFILTGLLLGMLGALVATRRHLEI